MKIRRRFVSRLIPPVFPGFLLVLIIAIIAACDSGPEPDTEISFRELEGYLVNPASTPGTYVFRTKAEWDDARSPVPSPGEAEVPPSESFADSMVLGVSYGEIWCTHDGGDFARIVRRAGQITVTVEPLILKDTVCLAGLPLQVFAKVPRSPFTTDTEVVFKLPELPNP